jgi:hypothetical protein
MRLPALVSTHDACLRRTFSSRGRTLRRSDAEVHFMRGQRSALSHRVRAAVAVLALTLGAVACSSDDDSDAASTSVARSTTDADESTTTTVSSTTTSSAPSTSTSSSTSSSTSTSTTIDPAAKAEADIRAAIKLAERTFSACLVAMPDCDPSTLAVARAGDLLERNVARINEWNAAGYTVRHRDQFRYVIEEVTVAPSGTRATALVCIADDSDLVHPGAGPGGADVIIDDSFTSGRSSWDMRLDPDGHWRAYDAPAVGPTESSDVCPDG